jgi:hypothetical protein
MVEQSASNEFSVQFLNAKTPVYTTLPRGVILAYAAPRIAFGIMGTLFVVYFMKFATDVLLIAPAVIGTILAVGRLWDGITDPIIGFLSDRTAHWPATAVVILRRPADGPIAYRDLVAARVSERGHVNHLDNHLPFAVRDRANRLLCSPWRIVH